MDELPMLPSLYHNGALNSDNWAPDLDNRRDGAGSSIPEVGDLVGWRYGAWRCARSEPVDEVDLSDEEREQLDRLVGGHREEFRPAAFMRNRPRSIELRHESGPFLLKPGEPSRTLHDGTRVVHFRTRVSSQRQWYVLKDPYQTCSCHGHIWPCQAIDQNVLALHQGRKMDRLIATTEPGVCAHCLEPITTRQKSLTFPEPSRLVPGAPGPTFHAGRSVCWAAAEEYERDGRLADNPDVVRVASCPGIRFIHERHGMPADKRLECTAGPFCTGLHGPAGYRDDAPCWYQIHVAANEGAYVRPSFDCGYRGGNGACIGGDLSSGGSSISPTAADVMWEQKRRRK